MAAKLQLIISENNKVLETVSKETNTQPASLVKSLEDFQQLVNAALTKVVESSASSDKSMEATENGDDEDEADEIPVSPNKRRK